ncbi:MAG: phosphoribosylformylglycinamidine cyclo-ligase [Nitrospinae bacterium]|nr:phosphoribosylformylglycinamidine cyclo-ligase [Nitrospinota bacterium]
MEIAAKGNVSATLKVEGSGNITYKTAGVDIDAGNESLRRIKNAVKTSHNKMVMTGLGTFGSLYDLSDVVRNYKEPALVQSVDGVGTKLMIARMMNRFDTVGVDLVNHSLNDILCQGARGITFLDYIAVEKLDPSQVEQLVIGMAGACAENGVALVGGETAELPGIYAKGEYDLAGCITGVVEKSKILTGAEITEGDVIVGLKSSGLHTNGYTLARKVLLDKMGFSVDTSRPELGCTVGEALLAPHRDYSKLVWPLLQKHPVKGIAHITGGGFVDNIPRILPNSVTAVIKRSAWEIPPLFRLIQEGGAVPEDDMYRSTNMGIGLVIVIDKNAAPAFVAALSSAGEPPLIIGHIEKGNGVTKLA